MFYCPLTKEAYLAPPRTASRSISTVLKKHGWQRWLGRHDNLTVCNAVTAKKQPPADMPRQWSRVLCTVRNPFDVLVSWWTFIDEQPDDFNGWLQQWFLAGKPSGAVRALPPRVFGEYRNDWTHVIRYERLEQDLCAAFDWWEPGMLGWTGHGDTRRWELLNPPQGQPHDGYPYEYRRKPYQEYYSDESRVLVETAYADELRELGYSFEGAA